MGFSYKWVCVGPAAALGLVVVTRPAFGLIVVWNPPDAAVVLDDADPAFAVIERVTVTPCEAPEVSWTPSPPSDLVGVGVDVQTVHDDICRILIELGEPLIITGTNPHGAFTVEVTTAELVATAGSPSVSLPYVVHEGVVDDGPVFAAP